MTLLTYFVPSITDYCPEPVTQVAAWYGIVREEGRQGRRGRITISHNTQYIDQIKSLRSDGDCRAGKGRVSYRSVRIELRPPCRIFDITQTQLNNIIPRRALLLFAKSRVSCGVCTCRIVLMPRRNVLYLLPWPPFYPPPREFYTWWVGFRLITTGGDGGLKMQSRFDRKHPCGQTDKMDGFLLFSYPRLFPPLFFSTAPIPQPRARQWSPRLATTAVTTVTANTFGHKTPGNAEYAKCI